MPHLKRRTRMFLFCSRRLSRDSMSRSIYRPFFASRTLLTKSRCDCEPDRNRHSILLVRESPPFQLPSMQQTSGYRLSVTSSRYGSIQCLAHLKPSQRNFSRGLIMALNVPFILVIATELIGSLFCRFHFPTVLQPNVQGEPRVSLPQYALFDTKINLGFQRWKR